MDIYPFISRYYPWIFKKISIGYFGYGGAYPWIISGYGWIWIGYTMDILWIVSMDIL